MTRPLRAAVALLVAWTALQPAGAGWKQVSVDIAIAPLIATEPGEKILVAMFRSPSRGDLDVGLEVSRWVRREIGRQTALQVLDVPPPEIPEQRADRLATNDAFWRQLGRDFGADIVVAGIAEYRVDDRSGFVSEDVESPMTGQTVRRTRYAERRGYLLKLDIFFFKGDNGALIHREAWSEERVVEGTAEELQQLFDLLEMMRVHVQRTLLPGKMQEPRYIWVD